MTSTSESKFSQATRCFISGVGGVFAYGRNAVRFYVHCKIVSQHWPSDGVRESAGFSFPSGAQKRCERRFSFFKLFAITVAVLLLAACGSNDNQTVVTAKPGERFEQVVVDHVKDGDSFRAVYNGQKIEVRLFGIDAPERKQPYADASRKAAVKLLGKSPITLVVKDTDRYERIVAEAFVAGSSVSVNQRLVEQGAVWVYRQYTDSPALIAAEEAAVKNSRGLWALPESQRIAPWVLRKKNRK